MPLTLIAGPLGSGKTTQLLDILKESLPQRSGLFIVPSEVTAGWLRRHLLGSLETSPSSTRALIGDVFISWPKFVRRLADARRPGLSRMELTLFIYKLMVSHPLRYFRPRRPSLGIARQFAETILALKRNGIGPPRLRQILKTRGSLKENDLLTIFERYEEARRRLCILDEGDLVTLATKNVQKGCATFLQGIETIVIDEFNCISPGQMEMIRALKKALPRADIRVSFPLAPSQESLYAAYLERGLTGLGSVADRIVHLKAQEVRPPEVSVKFMRSPRQEARATVGLIQEELARSNGQGQDVVLVSRPINSFLEEFLIEADAGNLLLAHAHEAAPMSAPVLHRLLAPASIGSWPDEAPIEEYVKRCIAFVRDGNIIANWNEELGRQPSGRIHTSRSLAALSGLEELLNRLLITSRLVDVPPVRREAFAQFATSELAGLGIPQVTLDRVLPFSHISFDSGLALPVRQVFIPRMVEGNIPCVQTERLFFSEADRLAPEPDPTIDAIFPTPEEALASEAYTFDTFLAKCRERLTLTYPIINNAGAEVSPSAFLDAYSQPQAILPPPPMASAATTPGWDERVAVLAAIEDERAGGGESYPGHRGLIADHDSRALVRARFTRKTLSPTSLERYAQCPFVFFVEKVLGLVPREEETPEILPKDRGTILHTLLQRFYERSLEIFRTAVADPTAEKKLEEIVDRILDEVLLEHAELVGRMAQGLKPFQRRAIKTMAWQVIKTEFMQARALPQPLFPCACEWAFGTSPENTLAIPVEDDEPALVAGRVDRVDADAAGQRFVIVDYKTGAKVGSVKGDILKGRHLQLPLYVEATRRFLLPQALALGGLLLAVQLAEKKQGFVLKEYNDIHYMVGRSRSAVGDEAWNEAMAATMRSVANYAAAMRNGLFEARPADKCPRHCDYADVCRYFDKGAN